MKVVQRDIKNVAIIDVEGEIDLYNAPMLKNMINDNITKNKLQLVVNLEKVGYIDSSGIGVLISSLSHLKKNNGTLKILNITLSVKKVFELTRLDNYFEIFDDETAALNSFQ